MLLIHKNDFYVCRMHIAMLEKTNKPNKWTSQKQCTWTANQGTLVNQHRLY